MKWILPEDALVGASEPRTTTSIIEDLYKKRNITDKEKFLNPKMDDLYDPFLLHNMKEAVEIISDYAKNSKKIFIHGDFDVDGITSTSLLWNFLHHELKADVMPYIPSRFTEGYGLSEDSITSIINQGGELIVTVDCGVKDIALVHKYSEKVKFIITDHHTILKATKENDIEGSMEQNGYLISKDALAVIHPDLNDYPFKELCGVGVTWKLCAAINSKLGLGINMQKYLDLVALGTVCDVMPLIDENRVIVKLGINQMKKTENVGIETMLNELQIDKNKIDTYHLGFIMGPRLNASGRMESAIEGVRLLTTRDKSYAKKILEKLNILNATRQKLTQEYLLLAEDQIEQQKDNKIYIAYGEEWPEGIIGLIAGKLTEKYSRPVIVGSTKEDFIKASARSIESYHIADSFSKISEHLMAYGGHAQAAGLTFKKDKLDLIRNKLTQDAENKIKEEDMEKKLYIDSIINNQDPIEIAKEVTLLSPFGLGNVKPRFAFLDFQLKDYKLLGKDKNHIKFRIKNNEVEISCIKFNCDDNFKSLLFSSANKISVVGNLELEEWNGNINSILKVEDVKLETLND